MGKEIGITRKDVSILNETLGFLLKNKKISVEEIGNICKKHDVYGTDEKCFVRIHALLLLDYKLITEDGTSNYQRIFVPTEKASLFLRRNYFKKIRKEQIRENLEIQQLDAIRRNRVVSLIAVVISVLSFVLSLPAICQTIVKIWQGLFC